MGCCSANDSAAKDFAAALPVKYGISLADILALVQKYGPEVLKILNDALAQGLSLTVIKEILDLFGISFLQETVDKAKAFKAKAIVQGDPVTPVTPPGPAPTPPAPAGGALLNIILQIVIDELPNLWPTLLPLIISWLTALKGNTALMTQLGAKLDESLTK